jgi:hypothetical protein
MSLKANSAWLGAAAVALAMLLPAASMAQAPMGPRQGQYNYRYDPGLAPRPDFPGAKQSYNTNHKMSRSMSRYRHSQNY